MQYHAIPCNTMQYHAIPCNTMQYHAIPCIINNCWRSVPLPCGQYNGHFYNTMLTMPGEYIYTSIIFQTSNIDVCWVWSRLGGQLQRLLYLPLAPATILCMCPWQLQYGRGLSVGSSFWFIAPRCSPVHMWKFSRGKTSYTIIMNFTPLKVILTLFIAPSQISVQDAYSQDQEVSVCPQRNED